MAYYSTLLPIDGVPDRTNFLLIGRGELFL
jgi:hypothetical protein